MLEAEERTGVLVPPAPPKSGLNLNKRSQVIRMSRRGEQAEKIAASLNLPQREVELLLKVYGRVVYNSQPVNESSIRMPSIPDVPLNLSSPRCVPGNVSFRAVFHCDAHGHRLAVPHQFNGVGFLGAGGPYRAR